MGAPAPAASGPGDEDAPKLGTVLKTVVFALLCVRTLSGAVDGVLYTRTAHKMQTFEWALSQVMFPWSIVLFLAPVVFWQRWTGRISDEAWHYPQRRLMLLGAVAGFCNLLQTFPSAYLPGSFTTLTGKLVIPLYMVQSIFFFKTKYSRSHYIGASITFIGTTLAVVGELELPDDGGSWTIVPLMVKILIPIPLIQQFLMRDGDLGAVYFRFAYAFYEGLMGFVLLPTVFIDLPGRTSVTPATLGSYLSDSLNCLLGRIDGPSGACGGTLQLWCVYVLFNIVYIVTAFIIVKHMSAVANELASAMATPIEVFLFCWPFLAGVAEADGLSWETIVSLVLVLIGNVTYVRAKEITPTLPERPLVDDEDLAPGETLTGRVASVVARSVSTAGLGGVDEELEEPLLAMGPTSGSAKIN